ncbi:MAG: hypothetical protein JXR54_09875 [Tannerellaceae bacterium]|nr:hypothetical protein [Tannerellaceae bacterium]
MQYNNDFKYDLKVGNVAEKKLSEILSKKKIEVKIDRWAQVTGNIAVEFESRGKPSGITTTKADYWCFVIEVKSKQDLMILVETKKLKDVARRYWDLGRIKRMGDNNTSMAVLVPYKEIIETLNSTY